METIEGGYTAKGIKKISHFGKIAQTKNVTPNRVRNEMLDSTVDRKKSVNLSLLAPISQTSRDRRSLRGSLNPSMKSKAVSFRKPKEIELDDQNSAAGSHMTMRKNDISLPVKASPLNIS